MDVQAIRVSKVSHVDKNGKTEFLPYIQGYCRFWKFWRFEWFMEKNDWELIGETMGWLKKRE